MNDYLRKLSEYKVKMMFLITSLLVTSFDTKEHKPTATTAPTKGFMDLDNTLVVFSKRNEIERKKCSPITSNEPRDYDYKIDGENIIFEGHMLAHAYANSFHSHNMLNWLLGEITSRYMAECFAVLQECYQNKAMSKPSNDCNWFRFAGLIRNGVSHDYYIDWYDNKEKDFFRDEDNVEYEGCRISKSDRGKHFIKEWGDFSYWIMLKLAKEIEMYIRSNQT